ncbi:collagen alpha chain-like isoform X2 [Hippopotamus amphibius kiboko]|uniref:collagen alpha chain-like isoform X2 n=1 Tax=Hippopotamus amphibius kiboko TaxID=575201 RepID=UPI0025989E6E|nr:collagen alpha chain-like isoform X2 [Hippopotamus amphibius kiboko]
METLGHGPGARGRDGGRHARGRAGGQHPEPRAPESSRRSTGRGGRTGENETDGRPGEAEGGPAPAPLAAGGGAHAAPAPPHPGARQQRRILNLTECHQGLQVRSMSFTGWRSG